MTRTGGLYIHVPFCVKKCDYCDFYSISDLSLKNDYLAAVVAEIKLAAHRDYGIDTIYFGGGTPSLLAPREIELILSAVRGAFYLVEPVEVTLEVNPGTIDAVWLADVHALGVNRLNIGIQSFQDDKLALLGRIHTGAVAVDILGKSRKAGFDNIGLDLIYGTPHETKAAWQADLDTAFGFAPAHLSCYMLSFEPHTPLFQRRLDGETIPLDDGEVARRFAFTSRYAQRHGYDHYEVSNFARGWGMRSRHNEKYWSMVPYTGLGPAAHSFDGVRRWWNISDVRGYIRVLAAGRRPVKERETLTREQLMIERLMLGLRTFKGVDVSAFEALSGCSFARQFHRVIERVMQRSWGRWGDGRFALTLDGMVYLDRVVEWFVEEISA